MGVGTRLAYPDTSSARAVGQQPRGALPARPARLHVIECSQLAGRAAPALRRHAPWQADIRAHAVLVHGAVLPDACSMWARRPARSAYLPSHWL